MAIRKNRVLCRLLAVFMAFCCVLPLLFPAAALAGTDVVRVRVIEGGVSLRSEPNENAPKIRGIHSNYELYVQDERNGWYKVTYKGDTGWITGKRVIVIERRDTGGGTSDYVITPTPRPTSTPVQYSSGNFEYYSGFGNVIVWPSMKLATRSGPATRYDEDAGTFRIDTSVLAMSRSYDAPNNRWWIQFEMVYRGKVYCLYTGEQRFSGLDLSRLPVETVIGRCSLSMSAEAYYAPSENAARMNWDVPANVDCDIIAMVPGVNSDFIQIEFYDSWHGTWRRAWIKEWYADEEYFY